MSKERKTRKEKIKTTERRINTFKVREEWLEVKPENQSEKSSLLPKVNLSYLRLDLTKTFVLTMLVLALEIALWQYLSKN